MPMLNTGFSEITEARLEYHGNDVWFTEVVLTGRCNFNCQYCNRFSEDLDVELFFSWLQSQNTIKHIQLTGGEPTIHPRFEEIVAFSRNHAKVLGLSTNGSWSAEKYLNLPVDMFSISLDDYDTEILKQRGYKNPKLIAKTIETLSHERYVNIGLFVDELNVARIEGIIDYLLGLGVSDIKISTSSKAAGFIPKFTKTYEKYPILHYRVENFKKGRPMRGFPANKCMIAPNDVTIVGNKHYPCLVYFREKGAALGEVDGDLLQIRRKWSEGHDCKKDPICSRYCMDFKCDFNHAASKKWLTMDGEVL